MKIFAIYSAIVGNYDEIIQPLYVDDRFDYILFSNDIPEKQVGVWKIQSIPYDNQIQTKIARWVKTHPEELLPDYVCSIWVDANIQISSSYIYSKSIDLFYSGAIISSMKHPVRDCVYDEAAEILAIGLDHEQTVVKWINRLKGERFPSHYGLFETSILFRTHKNQLIQQFDGIWWDCILTNSKRDQLSFTYALNKTGLKCIYFLPDGENIRNSNYFNYISHDKPSKIISPNKKEDPLFSLFNRKHQGVNDTARRPAFLYLKITTAHFPRLLFSLFCLYYRVTYLFSK